MSGAEVNVELRVSCALCGAKAIPDPCPPNCHFRANQSREHLHFHCPSEHPDYPRVVMNHPYVVQFRVRGGAKLGGTVFVLPPEYPPDDLPPAC